MEREPEEYMNANILIQCMVCDVSKTNLPGLVALRFYRDQTENGAMREGSREAGTSQKLEED